MSKPLRRARPSLLAEALRTTPLVVALVAPLVFFRGALDVNALPKMTVVLVGAIAVLALWAQVALITGQLVVPWGWPGAIATAVAGALVLSAASAPVSWYAVVGQEGRNNTLLLYLSSGMLYSVVVSHWTRDDLRRLQFAFIGLAVVLSLYGALQGMGYEPMGWRPEYGRIVGTLGNTNFYSGYLGILVPLIVATALGRGHGAVWPLGLLAAAASALILWSGAIQGLFAAAGGLVVVLIAWLLARENRGGRSVYVFGSALVLLGFLGILSLLQIGPLAPVARLGTLETRQWYWQAAVSMVAEDPLTGVGLGHYADHYRRHRPDAATLRLGSVETADSPHSVPLNMFAEGGIPLGLAYLAFVAMTGCRLLRGLRQGKTRDELLLLGGFGGAWLGYQLQSVVSIDVPPLVVTHFLVAGTVVAATGGARRRLPFPRPTLGMKWIGMGMVMTLALVTAWYGTVPFRANREMAYGRAYVDAGQLEQGLERLRRAAEIAPSSPLVYSDIGLVLAKARRLEPALAAYRGAVTRAPLDYPYAVTAARLARAIGREQLAVNLFERAVMLDPTSPAAVVEYADLLFGLGRLGRARAVLEPVLRVDPDQSEARALMTKIEA